MSFKDKVKQTFRSFMNGRHGPDQLGSAILVTGLVMYVLELFLRTGVLSTLGLALYVYSLFRMLSRNEEKRSDENRRYVAFMDRTRKRFRQAKSRFDNRKVYKYFKCPSCKSWLRLPRNAGEVKVTCGRCHHSFSGKA